MGELKLNAIRLNTVSLNTMPINSIGFKKKASSSASGDVDENGYIIFADPEVARICAENWGDGTGITKEQAAAVTSIGTAFSRNAEITSFDEFKYFTGVTVLGDYYQQAFFGCANLKSVVIPNTMTTIGYNAFSECENLDSVGSLDSITHCEFGAFSRTGFYSDVVASNVECLGGAAFVWSRIRSIVLPKITKIESVYGSGDNYSSIAYCTNLLYALLGENCTDVGWRCFSHNGDVMQALICLASTPPSGDGALDATNNARIYVPKSSVEAYKEASNWSEFASRIFSVENDLPLDLPQIYAEVEKFLIK